MASFIFLAEMNHETLYNSDYETSMKHDMKITETKFYNINQ